MTNRKLNTYHNVLNFPSERKCPDCDLIGKITTHLKLLINRMIVFKIINKSDHNGERISRTLFITPILLPYILYQLQRMVRIYS